VDVVRFTLALLMMIAGVTSVARADFAQDLARIHVEAVGGRTGIQALKAFKATGVTRNERGELRFMLWAARPHQIRTEVTSGARTIVQVWDGKGQPWRADSQARRITFMTGEQAEEFKTEAEFDDPLIPGADRKVSLDYAGEVELDGREFLKVLVTLNLTETSFVYLDPATYLIVRSDVVRHRQGGEVVRRTDYSDFKSVSGVMLPHRLIVSQNGKRLYETVIDQMEPNPKLPDDIFKLPPSAKP
jgi:outer membrane lipoprotein-sorting protein